jgi:thermostable 8-oxoguanine DNA glycosylase
LDWAAIWHLYGDSYAAAVARLRGTVLGNVERELLFCLLGGHGVSYELAKSATSKLWELDVFSPGWSEEALGERLETELSRAQFSPLRADGSPRRYRFPRRKSRIIARAATWIKSNGPIGPRLEYVEQEQQRRALLCECPGIGLKTASWLLRNVGLGERLAVLDIHVLRALTASGRVTDARLPRDYLLVEREFLAWCDQLAAAPAAFDLLLWEFQRARALRKSYSQIPLTGY